ncbi:HNH endonuclease domain-containing protein [Haloplasma contractile]|uniref:HNH endonuclease domain-containing protein n=1 Tax=Haloplasma contractile TaxID=471825 RepID=UPI000212222C|nr:HNH endonuclease domain-containing protein [Haloplasma contractile]
MIEYSNYIDKWITILDEMNNDNTYKLAWGRAIIEICMNMPDKIEDEKVTITFKDISKKVLKYYWNQIFYFDLKQSDVKKKKRPVIETITYKLIDSYKEAYKTTKPEWFNKVYPSNNLQLDQAFTKAIIKEIPSSLSKDVCWRFPKVKDTDDIGIYTLYKKEKYIELDSEHVIEIKLLGNILVQLFNYKWALLLEKYNYSPKIANKIKGSGDEEVKRNNLTQYRKLLLLQFAQGEVRDFYTGEVISMDDISIDHVIPWSFIYSDDIWNLVVTTKSNNSSKSNKIPSQDDIKRLEKRNRELVEIMKVNEDNQIKKYINDLHYANENNVIREFYNYFRG